jgi:hypothetical protein
MNGFSTFECLLSAAVLVAICVPVGAPLYGSDRPISICVVIDEATRGEREPLRDYLTKAMGRPVNLAAPDSYRETVAHLADGSYDFACLGALMYMRAHAEYAFGDIDSTSAHLVAYHELMQAGINPNTDFKFRYSGSHLVTAAMVETGVVDAGAVDESVFNFLIINGKLNRKKVRISGSARESVRTCILRGFLGRRLFSLRRPPNNTFSPEWPRNRGLAVEMALRGRNDGTSTTTVLPALGAWKPAKDAGSHIPTATATAAVKLDATAKPAQIERFYRFSSRTVFSILRNHMSITCT